MVLFVFPEFKHLLPSLSSQAFTSGSFQIKHFPNRELYALIQTKVAGENCLVIGTIAPPEVNLLTFTLLVHTLKKDGAARVTAVLPYLGYARQDKAKIGASLGISWAGQLLSAVGVDELITIDVHSQSDIELLPLPVRSLGPAELFAEQVKELRQPDVVVVAPDEGALMRAHEVASAGGVKRVAHLEKVRADGVTHLKVIGEVAPTVIIVDDILDTGATLISCAEQLQKLGVRDIAVVVSHALFTGRKWPRLWKLGVNKIYCLDSVPAADALKDSRIQIIKCGPLLKTSLKSRG